MPTNMPYSKDQNKQQRTVAKKGTISRSGGRKREIEMNQQIRTQEVSYSLFARQISAIRSYSIMNNMAEMIMPASVALGMYAKVGVKNARVSRIRMPVNAPPSWVCTPLALLTAERAKEPVMAMDEKKLPKILLNPSAIISCEAFTIFPLAIRK